MTGERGDDRERLVAFTLVGVRCRRRCSRCAWRLMIRRYGTDAVSQAAMQGNAMLARGDLHGLKAWLKVIAAIERLQPTTSSDREAVQ